MLTGRYMHVLGHRTQIHLIRAYEENYFRILKNAGYHIVFVGKNDVFSQASFNFSVSEWQNLIGFDSGSSRFPFNESGYYSMLSTGGSNAFNDTKNGDYSAITAALNFLQNDPPEPFLLFLPTRGAHPPYVLSLYLSICPSVYLHTHTHTHIHITSHIHTGTVHRKVFKIESQSNRFVRM